MAILSTGPIENNAVSDVRPTQQVTVKIDNRNSLDESVVLIQGYNLTATRTLYVSEQISLAPDQVVTRSYFANLDAFEFVFTVEGVAVEQTEISVWGKNEIGQLVAAHRLVSSELEIEGDNTSVNRIYVANFNSNDVSVINGETNTVIATVPVGTNPAGIDVNPLTSRVYVANRGSNTISVINSLTNAVIASVPVGSEAGDVGVDIATNAIYTANFNSLDTTEDVTVIDGLTNTVIDTITIPGLIF